MKNLMYYIKLPFYKLTKGYPMTYVNDAFLDKHGTKVCVYKDYNDIEYLATSAWDRKRKIRFKFGNHDG